MSGPPRVRFAPSPTGSLHLGNARTALFNWLVARRAGGTVVLRIEDTDVEREREGSEAQILDDLRWLGLDWDEGPDVGGPHGPYRQSQRGAGYAAAVERLFESGRAYRCFCSDAELAAARTAARGAGPTPRYSGRCRGLSREESDARAEAGEPFAVRFRILPADPAERRPVVRFEDRLRGAVETPTEQLGDPVLLRRDGRPTYNFAVVVDDAAMQIDLVLRGDDHLSNTPRQVLLYAALGARLPEFAHLPMVRGADGSRLSKRHGAVSVAEYRRRGYPRAAVLNALALLGWSPGAERELVTPEELLAEFELERVSRSAATFDPQKLDWLSGQHLRRTDPQELVPAVAERLARAGLLPEDAEAGARGWLLELAELVRDSVEHLDQVAARCDAVFTAGGEPRGGAGRAALREDGAPAVVRALAEILDEGEPADLEAWREVKRRVREETGLRGKSLFRPIRVALTGDTSGPELDRLVPLIAGGHAALPDRIASLAQRARRTAEWLG